MNTIAFSFSRTIAANYERALQLAQQSTAYRESGQDKRVQHEATFDISPATIKTIALLLEYVAPFRSSLVRLNGAVANTNQLLNVFRCANMVAAAYEQPARYCQAENWYYPAFDDLPNFPCRLFPPYANSIPWTNERTRVDAIQAVLTDHYIIWCPFLELSHYLRELRAWIPTSPDHRLNPLIPYRRRGVSGQISIDDLIEPGGPEHPDNVR